MHDAHRTRLKSSVLTRTPSDRFLVGHLIPGFLFSSLLSHMFKRQSLVHVALCIAACGAITAAQTIRLTWISDTHLDPRYNATDGTSTCAEHDVRPPFGRPDCDSPPALLNSVVDDLLSQPGHRFMVFAGDWSRHDVTTSSQQLTFEAFRDTAVAFQRVVETHGQRGTIIHALPHPRASYDRFTTAVGNDDFVLDYNSSVNASVPNVFLANYTRVLSALNMLMPSELETFSTCGFYSRTLETGPGLPGLSLVMLNTVMYSLGCVKADGLTPCVSGPDPCGQLAFLAATLSDARSVNASVLIVGHIPPSSSFYSAATHPHRWGTTTFGYWRDIYQGAFVSILQKALLNGTQIVAQVFSHQHHGLFTGVAGLPLFVGLGSISPIFDNLPSYQEIQLQTRAAEGDLPARWLIGDVALRRLTNLAAAGINGTQPDWETASFRGTFPEANGFNDLTSDVVALIGNRLLSRRGNMSNALFWYNADPANLNVTTVPCSLMNPTNACQRLFGCFFTTGIVPSNFTQCLQQ